MNENNSNSNVSNSVFDNSTKNICLYCFLSVSLIIFFMLTPLNQFIKTSKFIKIISICILAYTLYLNNTQIQIFYSSNLGENSDIIKRHLNINIICSYVFSLSILLLIFFVIRSFWY
jgi:hypothetical protein